MWLLAAAAAYSVAPVFPRAPSATAAVVPSVRPRDGASHRDSAPYQVRSLRLGTQGPHRKPREALRLAGIWAAVPCAVLAAAGVAGRARGGPPVSKYKAQASKYAVGEGSWSLRPPRPDPSEAPAKPRKKPSGKKPSGRGVKRRANHPHWNPDLTPVLQNMQRLDARASQADVDAVLDDRPDKLSDRDYTTVLVALKRRSAWQVALRVCQWMMRQQHEAGADEPPRALPNRTHFQVVLNACAASGEARAARALAEKMASRGVALDVIALGSLALAHERAGEWERTATMLDDVDSMMAASPPRSTPPLPADMPDEGEASGEAAPREGESKPDTAGFVYSSAIRAHTAAGEWQAALGIFERAQLRGVPATGHLYSAALGACRSGKQASRALEIMESARADPDFEMEGIMYMLAMSACNEAKKWEASLELFAQQRAAIGLDAQAYAVAIRACVVGQQWERALELLEECESHEALRGNDYVWNDAMVACNRAGQPQKALELYDRMREGACSLSEYSVSAALNATKDTADWERAQSIYDYSQAVAQSSSMCTAVFLDVLVLGEQWELTLQYFDALRATGAEPSTDAFVAAVEACDHVDPDRAQRLVEEMKAKGLFPEKSKKKKKNRTDIPLDLDDP